MSKLSKSSEQKVASRRARLIQYTLGFNPVASGDVPAYVSREFSRRTFDESDAAHHYVARYARDAEPVAAPDEEVQEREFTDIIKEETAGRER